MSVREGKMNNRRERIRSKKVQLPNVQTINSIPLGMVNIYQTLRKHLGDFDELHLASLE